MNNQERTLILKVLADIQSNGRSPNQDIIKAINEKSLEIIKKL